MGSENADRRQINAVQKFNKKLIKGVGVTRTSTVERWKQKKVVSFRGFTHSWANMPSCLAVTFSLQQKVCLLLFSMNSLFLYCLGGELYEMAVGFRYDST